VSEDPQNAPTLRDAEMAPQQHTLAEILDRLPTHPGVYLMKDRRSKVIYVGKAANLRARVRQYFQPNTGDVRDFVPLLEGIVGDIDTVVTSNEKEALLLENILIKKHQPRFNVKLTDDKNFLVLRLDPDAEWPRLEVMRRLGNDGASYFGPYHSATSAREALRVVNRHFQLRTCTDHVLHNRRRPCLQYQIKRCPAPCVLPVAREEYGEQVRDVRLFLEGKNDELLDRLRIRMKEAAARTEFERAATVRDQLRALEASLEAQRVVSTDFVDQDVVGFHREGLALEMVVLSIRQGKMVGSRAFSFNGQEFPDAEILSTFLGLYYDMAPVPPDEVLLPFAISDAALKGEWLMDKRPAGTRRRKVEVLVPQRGPRHDLVDLARKNAAVSYASRRNAREDAEVMLARLQNRLRLPRLPRVIECYDISHVQGAETVASMVVFIDGRPEKSRYRTFKIQRGDGPDDFAAMYEVLSRRFRRARETQKEEEAQGDGEGDSPWRLPDLVVVDGGKGQLGMALAAARDVGIDIRPGVGLPIVALAKEREADPSVLPGQEDQGGVADQPIAGAAAEAVASEAEVAAPAGPEAVASEAEGAALAGAEAMANEAEVAVPGPVPDGTGKGDDKGATGRMRRTAAEKKRGDGGKRPDRIFLPHAKDAIPIRPDSAEMFVLQHLRDEAHRFAVAFHRGQRKRRTLRSALSDVTGIGATRQRALLRHFGSLKKIREASLEALVAVPGMSSKTAQAVLSHFAARPDPVSDTASRGSTTDPALQPAGPVEELPVDEAADAEEDALESAFAAVDDE
jgi:excinuclease ABC subunit C